MQQGHNGDTERRKTENRWYCLYAILFGLAYSQKALFTSNQNTKFISGLALAGYGDIAADWMAHVTDSFSLFSHVLKWQYQLLGLHAGVHATFVLLVALYGISALWLAKDLLANLEYKRWAVWLFALLWLFIHTKGIRGQWSSFFPSGLAGQYMLGTYYQPCCFGVLLLAGSAAYTSRRLVWAAICLILAPLFHPTYLISSALITTTIIMLPANRTLGLGRRERLVFFSLVGLGLAAYAVWYFPAFIPQDPLIQKEAHQILAEVRIPHHAIPAKWQLSKTISFFVFAGISAYLGRKRLMGQLLMIMLLFTGAVILWALIDHNSTFLVIAPWRVSVFLAPLSWIVLLSALVRWSAQVGGGGIASRSSAGLRKAVLTVGVLASLIGVLNLVSVYQRKPKKDHYPISRFLTNYHRSGSRYLVPLKEMKIRLEAGVPVYVTWKSHPVRADEFLEWYKRTQTAKTIYKKPLDQAQPALAALLEGGSVSHMIWPVSKGDFPFSHLGRRIYRDKDFSLWDLRTAGSVR